ncbi:hypothetical protein M5X00_29895 [Paenibacillus alvei]|uniref:hypothetical protein n=1 Tax=Paenibacillus alvei TaxID=44250 RepID=UPI000288A26A|nr:hypothetical protein [Paenibacillus alvei]EJW14435.1 hypothetical protein PAV_13c00540 [Paenibacillus alvei DSM 29]MCY9708195.1 hypothetical protein [Paenibacillus alvei]MCY9737903.1 hypothetical protein [Paenibacillus alvei]MCY9758435.1 hypothetical protein [Paenibacillus alvei]MEC0084505.1 hypothetical protein [Paenibacillus alvei]
MTYQVGDSIDLIRALIQFEGNYTFAMTTRNYDRLGGVCFSGNHNVTRNSVNFVLDKEMVESLKAAKSIEEVIEIYREIGFFAESGGTGDE